MPSYCVAFNCNNTSKKGSNISFHRFPVDLELKKKWINATKRKAFTPSAYSRICSEHFTCDDYKTKTLRRDLKKDAIPSVFNFPASSYLESQPKQRRVLQRLQTQKTVEEPETTSQPMNLESGSLPEQQTPEKNEDGASCHIIDEHQTCRKVLPFSPGKKKLRRQIKLLQQRLKRRERKLKTMGNVIELLKKRVNASEHLVNLLEENFSGVPLNLIMNSITNKKLRKNRKVYSEELKKFALTLYFYSPKAYKYLRKLNFCLPNASTLRRWLSKFKCSPGFLSEVFQYLKENVSKNIALKDVNLVFDSMSIRKQIIYDHNTAKYNGYVDLGGFNIAHQEELASEALVFQIVSLKHAFKCVIGYFFVDKIDATLLSQLIKTAVLKLTEVNVNVHNVTCDGPPANVSALKKLGCQLPKKPWFTLPGVKQKVFVMLDACHMIKLCRNTLAEIGTIESVDGKVSFSFITELNELQKSEGYKLANKLSDKHVNFERRKMNVQTAVQTISAGVADALEFLKTNNPKFKDSEPTIKFIRMFDRLFDILNSRDPFGKNYKEPLRKKNIVFIRDFLGKAESFILALKVEQKPVLKHPRKTFALGFLTNINTIRQLYDRLLSTDDTSFKYILTYKFSQDHIELLFSCIRAMGRRNDNPNVNQFRWALRKLMFRNSVSSSDGSNCLEFDNTIQTGILSEYEIQTITSVNQVDVENVSDMLSAIESVDVSYYQENVIYYIAGFIVRSLIPKLTCIECKSVLVRLSKSPTTSSTDFTSFVNMGKLYYPSEDVFKVVLFCHKSLKHVESVKPETKSVQHVILDVVMHYGGKVFAGQNHSEEMGGDVHSIKLIKMISNMFLKIKCHSLAASKSITCNPASSGLRQKLNKIVLFNNT